MFRVEKTKNEGYIYGEDIIIKICFEKLRQG